MLSDIKPIEKETEVNKFDVIIRKIHSLMMTIEIRVAELKKLYADYHIAANSKKIEGKIHLLTNQIYHDARILLDDVKEIRFLVRDQKILDDTETQTTLKTCDELYANFQLFWRTFYETQTHFETLRRKINRQNYLIRYPDASEDELKHIEPVNSSELAKFIYASTTASHANTALEYVKRRHEDIITLNKSLLEANRLFIDFNLLVNSQGETVKNIEQNIQTAKTNIIEGTNHLASAKKSRIN